MIVRDSVRNRLGLSRELLTQAEFRGRDPGHGVAYDVMISHDAASLALAAICDQLGRAPDKARDSILDYLVWLRGRSHPDRAAPGMDYFVSMHKARIELQDRYLLPSPERWAGVRATTLEYIEVWSRRFLDLELQAPAEDSAQILYAAPVTGSGAQSEAANHSQRRCAARYDCSGEADVRIPFAGPPARARIVNLSTGGCYAEMDQPFEVGRRVEIVLRVNRLSFRATGKVVYSQWGHAGEGVPTRYENPGVGIQFTGMSSGGRDRLLELVAELQDGSTQTGPEAGASSARS